MKTETDIQNESALTQLAVDVVNRYDDEQLWEEFFSTWLRLGKRVKPGHSGARMAAELLAAEVLRLRKSEQQINAKVTQLEKRVQWYVDRDSLKATNA